MDPLLIFLIYASSHTFHGVYRLKGYLLSISTSFYKDFIYSRRALFLASVSSVPNYVHSYRSLNHVHRIQSPRIKTTDLIDQTLCLSYLYRTPFQFQSFFLVLSQGQQLKDWTAALRIGVQPRTHSEEREHRYTRPLP